MVDNPMRGQAQSVFRVWEQDQVDNYVSEFYIDKYNRDYINSLNLDVLVYSIDHYYSAEFFDDYTHLNVRQFVALSVELFDTYNRKSTYDFFNTVTQRVLDHWYRSKLNEATSLVIGPAKNLPLDYFGDYLYYPYYLAPSIFKTDKLEYLESKISEGIRITKEGKTRLISMVYQRPNQWRDFLSSALDVILFDQGGITYSGRYKNNDRSIPFNYDYDIVNEYYSKFKYNLVVENEFADGWVTEKLINPLLVGCIPIYYDPFHQFPASFLNPKACIIVNDNNLGILNNLNDPRSYTDIVGQPVFATTAMETLNQFKNNFKLKINKLWNSIC